MILLAVRLFYLYIPGSYMIIMRKFTITPIGQVKNHNTIHMSPDEMLSTTSTDRHR